MRSLWAGALALGLCAGCATSSQAGGGAPTTESVPGPEVREGKAPLDFELPIFREEGATYSARQDRGAVVLLDVWATWCEPCRDALPVYEELARRYADRGLRVYTVNIDEDSSSIDVFLQDTPVQLPILLDRDARVSEQLLKVDMMPTTFLIDRKGYVRHVSEGFTAESAARYPRQIEELLAEGP